MSYLLHLLLLLVAALHQAESQSWLTREERLQASQIKMTFRRFGLKRVRISFFSLFQAGEPDSHLWHFGSWSDADDDAPGGCFWGHRDDQRNGADHGHVHWRQQGDREEARRIGEVKPVQPRREVKLEDKLEGVSTPE